jgi:ureidoglycolate lyase
MRLTLAPLTPDAFATFGTVTPAPDTADGAALGPARNLRPGVLPLLRWVVAQPLTLPATLSVMERHRFSSQSFLPADPDGRWLVVVAPAGTGGPDMTRAQAFSASADQAITYAPDVWHHPLASLDAPLRMALMTFIDGGPDDTEFFSLPVPVALG